MREPRGIVLVCSTEAEIIEVLHDAWALARRGGTLVEIVAKTDQLKCMEFVRAAIRDGTAFGWELHVGETPSIFAALMSLGQLLIFGTEEPEMIARLHQELADMNSEMVNTLRDAFKQQSIARRETGLSLQDFTQLSNELASLHREITKRVRDLERINRDYERRHAIMEQLERKREDFVQHLVHDLRNPLTSVNGAVGLALAGIFGPIDEQTREVLQMAKEGCDRLTEMIASMLDLAKLEAGKLDFDITAIEIFELLRSTERDFRSRALEHNVSIEIQAPEETFVLADKGILRRVLGNYVVNALKFSPQDSTVTLMAAKRPGHVRITVIDKGPGISRQHQDRLFTKYGQVERRGMSTGLGLAFCKEMVQAMNGLVGVHSIEGDGASFWFELPEAPPSALRSE